MGEKNETHKKLSKLAKLCLSETAYVYEIEEGGFNLYSADRELLKRFSAETECQEYLVTALNDKVFEVNAIVDDTPYEYVFHNGKDRVSFSWEEINTLKKLVENFNNAGLFTINGIKL